MMPDNMSFNDSVLDPVNFTGDVVFPIGLPFGMNMSFWLKSNNTGNKTCMFYENVAGNDTVSKTYNVSDLPGNYTWWNTVNQTTLKYGNTTSAHKHFYITPIVDDDFWSGILILDDFLFLITYLFGILYLIINKNTNEMFVGSKLAYIFIFLNLALILGCIVTYTTPLQETIMTGLLFAYVFLLWISYNKRK
jgi:hypothetical protein